MRKTINTTHIEGYLYEHDLQIKESGENSKNPGTIFISGTISIATDNKMTNVVPVHFTYVTATTAKGNPNATFAILNQIITGELKTVTSDGPDKATKLRIDSAVGLNEFYSDRNGKEELVSVKRNEGGFVHTVTSLNEDEKLRNTFDTDIVITKAVRKEANPEREEAEKVEVSGYIFDFRKALLPITYIVTNPAAMDYFEGLEATEKEPVFTKVKGVQVSTTVVRKVEEVSPWGDVSIREVPSTRKEFLITSANGQPYVWDDESSMTALEFKEGLENREIYKADMKKRQDEYKATRNAAPAAPAQGSFNF